MSEDAVELPLVLWHSWRMVLFRPRALRRLYRRVFRAGRRQPRRAHDTARLRHAFCAFTGIRASRRTAARTCGWRSPTGAPQAHPSPDNSGQLRGQHPVRGVYVWDRGSWRYVMRRRGGGAGWRRADRKKIAG